MSLLCIGLVYGVSKKHAERLRDKLTDFAKSVGIGVQFAGFDYEPLMNSYAIGKNAFAFNIADNFKYLNCENLLCPDWCNVHEADQRGPLSERLKKIQMMFKYSFEYGNEAELFIGECGSLVTDFRVIDTSLQDMCDDITTAYYEEAIGGEPSVRLLIKNAP